MKDNLLASAKHFCDRMGISEDTIKEDEFASITSVSFGDIKDNGYEIGVDVYGDKEARVNRIILSFGKNSKGQSIYAETREQEILDYFLSQDYGFQEWVDQSTESLERRFK